MKSITLYFKQGSSDKVYRAAIEQRAGGHVVTFAYGRRGSTMTTGTKTPEPVSLDEALAIFDKLEAQKRGKGYTCGPDIKPYTADNGNKPTGILPQLLNPVTKGEAEILLGNDSFILQPKHDGRRMLVIKRGVEVTGINRRGLVCGIPETIKQAALVFEPDFLLDGEAVGDTLHAFDLLAVGGETLRRESYRHRLTALLNFLAGGQQRHIHLVETRFGTAAKRHLFQRLIEENAEGVVFKHLDAPYTAGRPASGGAQLKHKFVETASVIVTGLNAKRSASMGLYDGNRIIPTGNVTIPPNQPMPRTGEVAEVKYLYAMPGTNALFQPVYLGVRPDIPPEECTVGQLKMRQEPQEVAA